jgi:hypothetical protein
MKRTGDKSPGRYLEVIFAVESALFLYDDENEIQM